MPTPPAQIDKLPAESELRLAALNQLRKGSNPFATQVATVGTADESLKASVADYTADQLSQLFAIIEMYREGRPATRVYPLLGDRGSGKTHLLYVLRDRLQRRAIESGDETMVVNVDRLTAGMDPTDYLLWQIVNHLLTQKGDGERILSAIAGRLTGRLLAETLRRLAPHQRVELIPPKGSWDRLWLQMGSSSRVQARLDGVDRVILTCDKKNPTPDELQEVCETVGLPPGSAAKVILNHLQQTESPDVFGWLRQQLYGSLVEFALKGEREPFEELHAGDYETAPTNVKNADNLSRKLLDTWIELLVALKIPVVVVFDQLEDYLRSPDANQQKTNSKYFTTTTTQFINELKHICILIFAERTFWTELMTQAEEFAAHRLTQPFPLPGRPAESNILMPYKVSPEVIRQLIQQRMRLGFPNLDLTGLPPTFPLEDSDIERLQREPSIRSCLRRLARRYDEIVYPVLPKQDLRKKLDELWRERLAAAANEFGSKMSFKVAFIPELQNALQGWLECLHQIGLTGGGQWSKVEMLTDPEKQPYGNLCVIRTRGPNDPGIGIAAWLGTKKAHSFDLRQRVGFFSDKRTRPIETLIMLRAEGEDALKNDAARLVYDNAIKAGHDLRIHKYEPKHLHAMMAFAPWLQAATAEVEAVKETEPDAAKIFHEFLRDLSKEFVGWIDTWRRPVAAERKLFQ